MKRILILITLLLSGSACTSSQPTSQKGTNVNTAITPQTTATFSEADFIARENQVWDALRKKDYDTFAGFLAEDQVEVESDGVYDKAGTLNGIKQVDFANTSLSDFKVIKLDNDAVLTTCLVKGSSPAFPAEDIRSSTVWVNRNGKWLAVFHQGTAAERTASAK